MNFELNARRNALLINGMKKNNQTMRNQKGAAVMILSHFLLLVALALSLAIYSGVFHQYKATRNEINYRQHFWLAEAGLECAYTQVSNQIELNGRKGNALKNYINGVSDRLSNCNLSPLLQVEVVFEEPQLIKVISIIHSLQLTRYIAVSDEPELEIAWLNGSWSDY